MVQILTSLQQVDVLPERAKDIVANTFSGGRSASALRDACNRHPLGVLESNVNITTVQTPFSFTLCCPATGVQQGDEIHIVAKSYIHATQFNTLVPYQCGQYYTPCVLRAHIASYDPNQNEGRILLFAPANALVLEDEVSGVLYEYALKDVGVKLYPTVVESYLVR